MPVTISDNSLDTDLLKDALSARNSERRSRFRAATLSEVNTPPRRNDLRPDLKMEDVRLDAIVLPKRRVRMIGPDDVAEAKNSILHFGASAPIIIGRDNQLIDGEVVIEAAKSLGLETLPAVRIEHLDEASQRALRLALNRIGHKRVHNVDALRDELVELDVLKQPIRILGYSDIEIDQVLTPPAAVDDPLLEPNAPTPENTKTQAGDMWRLGPHLLLCGDAKRAEDWERLLGEERVRLVLTDPPYAVDVRKVVSTPHRDFVEGGGDMSQEEFENLIRSSFELARDRLVDGGMLMSFMDWKHEADLVHIGKALGFEHINTITWVKHQGGMGSMWRSQTEFVVVLKTPGKHLNNVQMGKNGRDRTNVWFYPGAGTVGTDARAMLKHHPTPKPVPMLIDAIFDVTERDDIVVDPFGGSGSTLIACEQSDRRARLIEMDPAYCDLILKRWADLTGQEPERIEEDAPDEIIPARRGDQHEELDHVRTPSTR